MNICRKKYIRNCLLSGEQIAQIEVTIIKPSPQNEIPPNNRRLPLPPLLTSANKRRAWMFGQAQGTQSILQGLDRLTKHLKPIITQNHRGNDSHHIKGTQYLRVPHNIILDVCITRYHMFGLQGYQWYHKGVTGGITLKSQG